MEVPDEIQDRYLQRRRSDLEARFAALKNKNFSQLEKIGHQLKGNGSTFGYPELSIIGGELEDGSRFQDYGLIEKALRHLNLWLDEQS